MFRNLSRAALGAVCLGTIAVLGLNLINQKSKLFDPEKLEVASASDLYVPLSIVVPMGVVKVCVLGPYSSVESQLATIHPELAQQMDQTPVDEGVVRIVTFDNQSKILGEHDLPIGRGQVRISLGGIDVAFCRLAETAKVKVSKHESFITVQFAS